MKTIIRKLVLGLMLLPMAAIADCPNFAPGQLSASALNNALAAPCITAGTINGSVITNTPISGSTGSFTTISASFGYTGIASSAPAVAGTIGEFDISQVAATTTGLTSDSPVNVTSLILQPGDYNVEGSYIIKGSGSTYFTFTQAGINNVSGDLPNDNVTNVRSSSSFLPPNAIYVAASLPTRRMLVPAGTTMTVYLVAIATFTGSTAGAGGILRCRRVR